MKHLEWSLKTSLMPGLNYHYHKPFAQLRNGIYRILQYFILYKGETIQ